MDEPKRTRIQIRNEERILNSAQSVFAQYGFRAATMEKIAELSDMSQPNLHHYFKTKVDLYLAVLERTLDVWIDPLDQLDPQGEPCEELRRYIAHKLEMARKDPEASRVFAHEMLDGAPMLQPHLRTRVREKADQFASIVSGWIAEGRMRPIDPHHLIFLLWSATQHYADFAPQVKAVLGVTRLTKVEFKAAEDTICTSVLSGLFDRELAIST